DWTVLRLTDPLEMTTFRLLDQPRTVAALQREIADAGVPVIPEQIDELLASWRRLGLVFHESNQYIQVAVTAANQDLLHNKYWSTDDQAKEPSAIMEDAVVG